MYAARFAYLPLLTLRRVPVTTERTVESAAATEIEIDEATEKDVAQDLPITARAASMAK